LICAKAARLFRVILNGSEADFFFVNAVKGII